MNEVSVRSTPRPMSTGQRNTSARVSISIEVFILYAFGKFVICYCQ